MWLGLASHFLGFNTVWMWVWKAREPLLEICEYVTGNRNHYAMMKPGGVRRDITDEMIKPTIKMLDDMVTALDLFKGAVVDDPLIHARTKGVGILTKEDIKNFFSLVKIRKKDLVFSYLKAYLFLAWSFPGILSKRISLMRSKLKDMREHHVVEKSPSFYCCLNPGLRMPEISVPVILRYYRWEFLRQEDGNQTKKNQP